MTVQRIVTSARGCWRWQNAYRIVTYEARVDRSGLLRWYSLETSAKYSAPQLRRMGLWDVLEHGSLHRCLVEEVQS